MLYVPIVTPTSTQPSPRARELAQLLSTVIQEYEKHHPAVTGGEIRQALNLATQESKAAAGANRALAATLAGGLAALAGVGAFLATAGGRSPGEAFPMIAVGVGIVVVLGLVVVLKRIGNL